MKVFDCCERMKALYLLNDVAGNNNFPDAVRGQAAFAAENLLISDFEDA